MVVWGSQEMRASYFESPDKTGRSAVIHNCPHGRIRATKVSPVRWPAPNIKGQRSKLQLLFSYQKRTSFVVGFSKLQGSTGSQVPQNKYAELLAIIEELGKEIRPTYAGSKSAMERLKRGMSRFERFPLGFSRINPIPLGRNNPRQRTGAGMLGGDGEERQVLAADAPSPSEKNHTSPKSKRKNQPAWHFSRLGGSRWRKGGEANS